MPYEVDPRPETYNRVAKKFDFERLMNCLEGSGGGCPTPNESPVESSSKNREKSEKWPMKFSANVFSDDKTLYEHAQELGMGERRLGRAPPLPGGDAGRFGGTSTSL